MSFADIMNIGRTTKRYITNVLMVCVLIGIVYWDMSSKENAGEKHDMSSTKGYVETRPGLEFKKKWDVSKDTKVLVPGRLQQTTPVIRDHTPGETEGLGVFHFFEHFWKNERGHARREKSAVRGHQRPAKAFSTRVTNEQINTFHMDLPPLLANYKNPCWIEEIPDEFSYEQSYYSECVVSRTRQISKHGHKYRAFESYLQNRTTSNGQRWRIRCFPYFFLLGVGKAGTTDFFDTLKDYVSDFVPGFLKELHFWEWKRCHERGMCQSNDPRHPTFADYLDTYDAASEVIRRTVIKQQDGTSYHPLVLGDFTPSTLTFHPCWERLPGNEHLSEPRYTTAHYLYAVRPDTKLIVMLREPVDRIYSNYRMHFRLSNTPEQDNDAFHEEVARVLADLERCFREKSHRACVYSAMKFDTRTHVTNSLYEIFLRDWLLLFPRDQVLVIRMEDYTVNRVPFVRKTIDFLGLTSMSREQEWQIENKRVTTGGVHKQHREMHNTTRTLLRNFFRPWNQRLARLLKDDRFIWDY